MSFFLALLYIDGSEIPPQLDVVNIPLLTRVENTCQVGFHRISSIHQQYVLQKPPKKIIPQLAQVAGWTTISLVTWIAKSKLETLEEFITGFLSTSSTPPKLCKSPK